MSVSNANADQIPFIINLMPGYSEWELYGIKEAKSKFFHNTILTKANDVFLDTKKKSKKRSKELLSKNFNEFISKEQTNSTIQLQK